MADDFEQEQEEIIRRRRRYDGRHPIIDSLTPGGNLYGHGQTVKLDDSFRYALDQALARQADVLGNKFKEAIVYSKQLDDKHSSAATGAVGKGFEGVVSGVSQGAGQIAFNYALEKMKRGESVFDFKAEADALKGLKDTLKDIVSVGKGFASAGMNAARAAASKTKDYFRGSKPEEPESYEQGSLFPEDEFEDTSGVKYTQGDLFKNQKRGWFDFIKNWFSGKKDDLSEGFEKEKDNNFQSEYRNQNRNADIFGEEDSDKKNILGKPRRSTEDYGDTGSLFGRRQDKLFDEFVNAEAQKADTSTNKKKTGTDLILRQVQNPNEDELEVGKVKPLKKKIDAHIDITDQVNKLGQGGAGGGGGKPPFLPELAGEAGGMGGAGAGAGEMAMAGIAGAGAIGAGVLLAVYMAKQAAKAESAVINAMGTAAGAPMAAGANVINAIGGGSGQPGLFSSALGAIPSGKDLPGSGMLSMATFGVSDTVFENIDKLKEKAGLLADSFVDLIKNGIDPVNAYVRRWIEPFVSQTAKYNPMVVERLNLAFDNLSAAAGKMFVPIVEGTTRFADDLNRLYTSIADPIRNIFGTITREVTNFGRQFFIGVRDFIESATVTLRPIFDSLQGMGTSFGGLFRELFRFFGSTMEMARPAFEMLASVVQAASGGLRVLSEEVQNLARIIRNIQGVAGAPRALFGGVAGQANAAGIGNPLLAFGPIRMAHDMFNILRGIGGIRNEGERIRGPMTFAAQPARLVGIEEIGQQARLSSLSQGADVFDRMLRVQEQMLRELQNRNQGNQAQQGAAIANANMVVGALRAVMGGFRGLF